MNRALLLSLLVCASSSYAVEIPQAFLGTWKSDEALTLEDMEKYPVTDQARTILENGLFGKLIVVFRESEAAAYFPGESEPEFEPYQVIEATENSVTLSYHIEAIDQDIERTWYLEGELIYTITSAWNFREYFRRVE